MTEAAPEQAEGTKEARPDFRILPCLILLTLVAFWLRLGNVDFGLPALYHPDEGRKVMLFTDIAEGRPASNFSHPGLMVNSLSIVYYVARNVPWFSSWNLSLFDQRLLLGRLVSVCIGALTVIPVFLLARQIYGVSGAFIAGAAIAVAPMHVINSRYVKEEIYLAFFVVLSTLFLVKWVRKLNKSETSLWFFLSALAAGCAASSKYIGVTCLIAFLVIICLFAKDWTSRARLSLLAMLLGVLTFLLWFPQMSYNFAGFWRDFSYEASHGTTGADRETLYFWQAPDWGLFYLRNGVLWGIGWPVALAGLAGSVLAFTGKGKSREALIVVALMLAWYVIAELTPAKRGIGRDRYVLSALPLLAVMAGGFIHHFRLLKIPGIRVAAFALGLLLLTRPAHQSMAITQEMRPDTRDLANEFFFNYYSEDDFRVLQFGGYPSVVHPKARINERDPRRDTWDKIQESLDRSRFVTMSSFGLDRYEKFPTFEPQVVEMIQKVRAAFPYVARFAKDSYVSRGFHNPVIEIRGDKPREGYLYDGADPAEKKRDEKRQEEWALKRQELLAKQQPAPEQAAKAPEEPAGKKRADDEEE